MNPQNVACRQAPPPDERHVGQRRLFCERQDRAGAAAHSERKRGRLLGSEDIGALPVLESDRLVDIVTDRDIVVRALAEGRDPTSTSVGEIGSTNPHTVRAE